MKRLFLLIVIVCFCHLSVWSIDTPEKAVYNLIERVTPGYSSQYQLELIGDDAGNDVYEIDGDGRKIILRGNNSIALASAFNWY